MQTNIIIIVLGALLIASLMAYLRLSSLGEQIAVGTAKLTAAQARQAEEIRLRLQAETELMECKKGYERAENASNDGIWEWDVVTGASYLSARWKQLLGYRSDEPVTAKEHFFDRIHPADLSSFTDVRQAHLAQRKPYNVSLRLRCKNGEYRWFNSRGQATRNEQGQPLILTGFISDITGGKKMEEALLDSYETLRCILDTTLDGFLRMDVRGKLLDANLTYCQLSGYVREELLGMSIFGLAAENDITTSENLKHAIKKGHGLFECTHRRKDGSTWKAEVNINFRDVNDENDSGQILAFLRDITERKQAEEASRIAAIAFECQEGIIVMDANRTILQVNLAFTEITGYSQQEIMGKTTATLRANRHPASFYQDVWSKTKRTGTWHGEMWQRCKGGEDYPARVTITAVKDELARVTHYVCTLTDETLSLLREQQRLLNEAAHRDLLVREVHHRIKNNLQGITGILRQFAQKYPETAESINQAIGQVKSISVIHGLQGRSVKSSVMLCELISAIADEIQSLWQTPIVTDIPSVWRPCVIAENEAVPIALVLNELISNAVKHGGKEHGSVSVTLRKGLQSCVVQISIANTGQIAPDQWRNGGAYSGLQLVSALMPRHGARIVREKLGERIITMLELEPPVISPDPTGPE